MKWSKYKSDQHTISSPLHLLISIFLFILFYLFVNRKGGTGVCFCLFLFCKYVIVCQSAMYKCLLFLFVFCIFPTCNTYQNRSQAIDKNESTLGVFLDLAKAFDTVKHEILLPRYCMVAQQHQRHAHQDLQFLPCASA